MALTVLQTTYSQFGGGDGAAMTQRGVINFAAGQATGELKVGMKYIEQVILSPTAVTAGTGPATTQEAYCDETTDSRGGFLVDSTGAITISQTANTNAIRYAYLIFGR